MSGQIVLSSSGEATRLRWWQGMKDDGWMLVLPTRGQKLLSAERAAPYFSDTSWIEGLAGLLAMQRLSVTPVEEDELIAKLGFASAMQVLAWQRAGILLSKDAPHSETVVRWAALEGPDGLHTLPWCAAQVAASAAPSEEGEGAPLPKIYLEHIYGASPVELSLLEWLSASTEVTLRVRDVWGAEWIERSYAPMLETLGKSGHWQGMEDQAPDAGDRAKLAAALFPTTRQDAPRLSGGDVVHHRGFGTVEDELAAVAARLSKLVASGVAPADVVVALPDSPSYRKQARAILPSSGAPLAFYADAFPGEGIAVVAHRDLGARENRALFLAGADGAPDALPPGGGFTASDPALMPPILLDAFESRQGELFLSSVGSERRYTDSVARAFGVLTAW